MNPIPTASTASVPADELERHGIVRVPGEHFEYGGYRYTNLSDALAQAKRSGRST
jgi:hypothetical protein